MAKKLFSPKITGIVATGLLMIGMCQALAYAEDVIIGPFRFEANQAVDTPNVFISKDATDTIILESGAVLDANIEFTVLNLEQWEKWHKETGADPNKIADYGLVPLSALTVGNSGYSIIIEEGASVINRADASDGIMALGSVEMEIGGENMLGDTFVHGDFAGIFLEGFFDPETEMAQAVPRQIFIVNHGNVGSYAKNNLESSFGIWLAAGTQEDQFTLDNTGHIEGTESGFTVEGGFSDLAITNTGSITSGKLGLSIGQVHPQYIWTQNPDTMKNLIEFFSGRVTLDNHGEIIGNRFVGVGIWGDGGSAAINNHETGLIKSDEVAIQLLGGGEIVNRGTIEGGKTGIYIPNDTVSITHSGVLRVIDDNGDAILFGPAAKGGLVTLISSVDGNIRHVGDTSNALVILEDAGKPVFTENIDFGTKGEIKQLGGTWSTKDLTAGTITIEGGEMRLDHNVKASQGIHIGSDARLAFSEGLITTNNLVNRGVLDFTGGTLTISEGIFDYAETSQDLLLSDIGRPHLELIAKASTDNIRVLTIGSELAGPGALTLKGDSTVSVAEKLVVGHEGILSGVGTVDGNVEALSGSVVQPGHSIPVTRTGRDFVPGTLTITGDLHIEEDTVTVIKFQHNENFGKINVENDVSIEGGALAVESVSRGTVPDGAVMTFLTAGGTMTGEFNDIISLSPIYAFELGRTANDMFFTATRLIDYSDYAVTSNQRSAAGALANARENEELEYLVWNMENLLVTVLESDGRRASWMANALDQLSPEPYHAAFRMNLVHGSHMTRQMLHGARQSRMKLGTQDDSLVMPSDQLDNRAWIDPKELGASKWNSDRRVFYGLYRRLGDTEAADSRSGYDFKARGFYLGFERAIRDNLIAGANFGYAYTSVSFNDHRGDLGINGFRIGPHASYAKGDLSIDFAAALGWHFNRQQRDITLPMSTSTSARFDIYEGSAYLEARYAKSIRDYLTISPLASVHYTYQDREQIKEKGKSDAALKIDSDSYQSLRSFFGMGLSRQFRGQTFIIIPELFGGWSHESLERDIDIDAAFIGASASRFRVTAEGLARTSVIVGGGFTALFGEYNSAFLRYERELIDQGDINTLMAGVKWNF